MLVQPLFFIFLSRLKYKCIRVVDLWCIYVLYTLAVLILNPPFNIHPPGRVLIGKEEVEMDSVGEEVSLWEKMMQYPGSWAEGTLPLRSTMNKGNWGQARPYPLTIPWPKWGETVRGETVDYSFFEPLRWDVCLERLGRPQGRCRVACCRSLQTSDCIH